MSRGRSGDYSRSNEVDYFDNPSKLFKRVEERSWTGALSRLERNPKEAQIWVVRRNYDGAVTWKRLPIHEACMHSPPPNVVLALLTKYPEGAKEIDSNQRSPLHLACANRASVEVVRHLLMANPDAIFEEDVYFKTPPQIMLESKNPDHDVVAALKKGPKYYKKKIEEARARMDAEKSPDRERVRSRAPTSSRSTRRNEEVDKAQKEMIGNLEEELGKFSQKLAASLDQENHLKNQVKSLEKEIESLKDAIEEESEENEKDLKLLEEVQQSEQQMKRRLEVKEYHEKLAAEKVKDLERKLEAAIEAMKEAETSFFDERNKNQRNVTSLKMETKENGKEVEHLRFQLEKLEEERRVSKKEMQKLRTSITKHKESAGVLKSQFEKLSKEKKQIEKEMEILDSHLFTMDNEKKQIVAKLKQYEMELMSLRGVANEIENARAEVGEKNNQLNGKDEKIVKSAEVIRNLSSRLNDAEQRQGEKEMQLYSENQELCRELSELGEKIHIMERQNASILHEHSGLEAEFKVLQDRFHAADMERTESRTIISQLREDMSKLSNSSRETEQGLKEKLATSESLNMRSEAMCKGFQEELASTNSQINTLIRNKEDLQKTVYELQGKANETGTMEIRLSEQKKAFELEKNTGDTYKNGLENTVKNLTEKLAKAESNLSRNAVSKHELGVIKAENKQILESFKVSEEEKDMLLNKVDLMMQELEGNAHDAGALMNYQEHISELEHERENLYERLESQERLNIELRQLIEEHESEESKSISEFEQRLEMLEEAKAREINLLKKEQDHLREQIRNLMKQNHKNAESDEKNETNSVRSVERNSRKASLREKLASIEASSHVGSPPHVGSPRRSSEIVNDKMDTMSHVSGITTSVASVPPPPLDYVNDLDAHVDKQWNNESFKKERLRSALSTMSTTGLSMGGSSNKGKFSLRSSSSVGPGLGDPTAHSRRHDMNGSHFEDLDHVPKSQKHRSFSSKRSPGSPTRRSSSFSEQYNSTSNRFPRNSASSVGPGIEHKRQPHSDYGNTGISRSRSFSREDARDSSPSIDRSRLMSLMSKYSSSDSPV